MPAPSLLLPTAMLVGPGRTGTTSLFAHLRRHPQVEASRDKETQIFRPAILGGEIDESLYAGQFSGTGRPCRLEGTPSYFQGGERIAGCIRRRCGAIPVVVTLRDPVDRLVSNYMHIREKHAFDNEYGFERYAEAVIAVKASGIRSADDFPYTGLIESDYGTPLGAWIEALSGERVLVCFYEQLSADPAATLRAVADHLGLDPAGLADIPFPDTNKSHGIRWPGLHRAAVGFAGTVEPVLSRLPGMKAGLQRAYYGLNGGRTDGLADLRDRAIELVEAQCRSLPGLREGLAACRVSGPLPEWVDRWSP